MKKVTTKPCSATCESDSGTGNRPLQVVTTEAVSTDKHSASQIPDKNESQYQQNPKGKYLLRLKDVIFHISLLCIL